MKYIKTPSGAFYAVGEAGLTPIDNQGVVQSLQLGKLPYENSPTDIPYTPSPSVSNPTLTATAQPVQQSMGSLAPRLLPQPSDESQSNPLEKFNFALMDMLRRSQGISNAPLQEQLNRANLAQTETGLAPTPPEQIGALSGSDIISLKKGQQDVYNPVIGDIKGRIALQNEGVQRFESLLESARKFGESIVKISPSQEVINGYLQAYRSGDGLSSIPDEVRNTVVSKITKEDAQSHEGALRRGIEDDIRLLNIRDVIADANRVSPSEKPPTEAERRAFGFYERGKDAERNLASQENAIAGLGAGGQTRLRFAPNLLQTSEGKLYNQGKRQFIEAYLRKDSGAQISPTEFNNADLAYFTQPGDTSAVIAQKKASRQQILNSLKAEAGKAYTQSYGDTVQALSPVTPLPATVSKPSVPSEIFKAVKNPATGKFERYKLNSQTGKYEKTL